jgi:hypothetical protein
LMFVLSLFWTFSSLISKYWDVKHNSNCSIRIDRLLGIHDDSKIKTYAVCKKCYTLYDITSVDTEKQKLCTYIKDPNHRWESKRGICGEKLLERDIYKSVVKYRPKMIFCWKSLIDQLQIMFKRPNFLEDIEHWRKYVPIDGVYTSVYDGSFWNDFKVDHNNEPLLDRVGTLAFLLHIDWVSPFKHSQYSIGVIFLVILNLSHRKRTKIQNIILLGVIPGGKERGLKIGLNNFLKFLVDDLKRLWNGVNFKTHKGTIIFIRAFLMACSCDIPAARKLCGFSFCTAIKGCSRCNVSFPSFSERDIDENNSQNLADFLESKYSRSIDDSDDHTINDEENSSSDEDSSSDDEDRVLI